VQTRERTNWDKYYESPFVASSLTRKYTNSRLISAMCRFLPKSGASIAELGGANSCFFSAIAANIPFGSYHIVDNNILGLTRSSRITASDPRVTTECADIMQWENTKKFDLVYSVGLIEHFDETGTSGAISRHFSATKPGGYVIISVPTPTLLYRTTRAAAGALGLWNFPDERPFGLDEMNRTATQYGQLVHSEILWPLFLTQLLAVYRAKE
jgi:SAM-dependent methyltransferase